MILKIRLWVKLGINIFIEIYWQNYIWYLLPKYYRLNDSIWMYIDLLSIFTVSKLGCFRVGKIIIILLNLLNPYSV